MSRQEGTSRDVKVLCLVWAPFSARMDELSREIGGRKFIFTVFYGHMYLAPLRYIALFFKTGYLILREKPDVIYAQNPSIFCPLSCLPYCKVWRKKLVIDHHAVWSMKTFSMGVLGWMIRKLEKFVIARAYANTTPHTVWARELEKMGARNVLTIYDCVQNTEVPKDETVRSKFAANSGFVILAPHGGHPLERIEEEVEAVRSLNSTTLILSGPESKLKTRISKINLGENVHYVGFLGRDEYEKLKASIDLGLSITDEPFTISHSLLEFAASSVPALSSDEAPVRELFGDSLIYVRSSKPGDIRETIQALLKDRGILEEYRQRIKSKQEEFMVRREREIQLLRNLMFGAPR